MTDGFTLRAGHIYRQLTCPAATWRWRNQTCRSYMAERTPRLAGSAFETNSTTNKKNPYLEMLKDLNSNCGGYHGNVVRILHCLCVVLLAAQTICDWRSAGEFLLHHPWCFQVPSEISNRHHKREKTKREISRCSTFDFQIQAHSEKLDL